METALNKSTVPMVTFVSVQAKPEISEVKPKDSPVQLDKDVTRDQSSDTLPEQEISLPDLYQRLVSTLNHSTCFFLPTVQLLN